MSRIPALIVSCWLAAPAAAFAAWTEVRTPHYLLIGDASRGDLKRIAQRFEQFHALMQQVLSRDSLSLATPTVVFVFKDSKSFRPYVPLYNGKPVDRAGLAVRDGYINYVAVNAEGGSAAYSTVFHELAHLISFNLSQITAMWFLEGVAEYYSSFEVRDNTEVLLGVPITAHAVLLREQFMPLRELLAVDQKAAAYHEQGRASVFYAQSWALLHYLRFSPATRERFRDYMRLAEEGVPQEQAITRAFGLSLSQLENALRSYVQQFSMMAERRTLRSPLSDADLQMSETTEAAVLPLLAGLQAAVDRETEAERRLATAPPSPAANAILAQIRLEKRLRAEALGLLQRDATYTGFLDHYLTAASLARYLAGADEPGDEDAAREALRARAAAAVGLRADVPEAWRMLAFAHLLAGEAKEARAAMERALLLAPANEYYRLTYADALARLEEFVKARSVLGELMAHGRTPEVRAEARRVMQAVVKYELAVNRSSATGLAAREAGRKGESERPQMVHAFRALKPGETQVYGTLTEIECGRDGRVTLVVAVDGTPLRISAAKFADIEFITYRPDLQGRVSCGKRAEADAVLVTWAGPPLAAGAVAATVAVEFTPKDYRPK